MVCSSSCPITHAKPQVPKCSEISQGYDQPTRALTSPSGLWPAHQGYAALEAKQVNSPFSLFLVLQAENGKPQEPFCDYHDYGILRYRLIPWELDRDHTVHFFLGNSWFWMMITFSQCQYVLSHTNSKRHKIPPFKGSSLKFYCDSTF